MKRNLLNDLEQWKNSENRKPLLLLGARQVGKTWLVHEFGQSAFKKIVSIDFMLDQPARAIFDRDLDPKRIIQEIEIRTGEQINPADTLLFFDEIQEAPKGITSLKYFCENMPEQAVIAAGSFMGMVVNRQDQSFPVGKINMLTLYPMTFDEFVAESAGEQMQKALIEGDFNLLESSKGKLHDLLKSYFIVGGMPEAVSVYSATKDFSQARRVQQEILANYEGDFGKHATSGIIERMRLVWHCLPSQLAKENKKFIFGAVKKSARARDFEESIQWLIDYGVAKKVPRVSALRLPLSGYANLDSFKLFTIDVGILGALSGLAPNVIWEGSNAYTEFKGAFTEQFVLQQLTEAGFNAYYWSAERGTAEIDFAIEDGKSVIPIEVKAAENLRSKSLSVACEKFGIERALRFSMSDYREESWLTNVPLWGINSVRPA